MMAFKPKVLIYGIESQTNTITGIYQIALYLLHYFVPLVTCYCQFYCLVFEVVYIRPCIHCKLQPNILSTSLDIVTSSLASAILNCPLPVWWKIILSRSIALLDPENIGLAIEIAFLFRLQAEIKVFPACRPLYCLSGLPLCRVQWTIFPLSCWTPKMWGIQYNFVSTHYRSRDTLGSTFTFPITMHIGM